VGRNRKRDGGPFIQFFKSGQAQTMGGGGPKAGESASVKEARKDKRVEKTIHKKSRESQYGD